MLTEFRNLSQRVNEPLRRWFESDDEDLIVWFGDDGAIVGFQLCYDRTRAERALTWNQSEGYSHMRVDDGEAVGKVRKSSPVLFPGGAFDAGAMLKRFQAVAGGVPGDITAFVSRKIMEYPAPPPP